MTSNPDLHLTPEQLKAALDAANQLFSLLKKKYPKLDAYLVLSQRGSQTGIISSPVEILIWIPSMIVDDYVKSELKAFIKEHEPREMTEKQKKQRKEEYDRICAGLSYHGSIHIEIRFNNLDYELIDQLREDDLVDRELTPQTKASIRIVLGTVASFLV